MRKYILFVGALAVSTTLGQAAESGKSVETVKCGAPAMQIGAIGMVKSTTGDVILSGAEGYDVAVKGSSISENSTLMTSAGSSALISVGSKCNTTVGPDAEVTFQKSADSREVVMRISKLAAGEVSTGVTTNESQYGGFGGGGGGGRFGGFGGFAGFVGISAGLYGLQFLDGDSDSQKSASSPEIMIK